MFGTESIDTNGSSSILPESVTLYVTTPLECAEQIVRKEVQGFGIQTYEPFPYVIAISADGSQLIDLVMQLNCRLSQTEKQLTKCWLALDTGDPSASQLMQAQSLSDFIAWLDSQWLAQILNDQRLETFFQPIVDIQQPEKSVGYECLLRGVADDGSAIAPNRLFQAAKACGLLDRLDTAGRFAAIDAAAEHNLPSLIFINFNPVAIQRPACWFSETLQRAEQQGVAVDQIVCEVVESEQAEDPRILSAIMDACREAGAKVALDDLGAGYNSLNLLASLQPDFIKLDMQLVRSVHLDVYKGRVAAKLLEMARDLDVSTVVEGVETAEEWQWMKEHGADYAQGFLFARPARKPPESSFFGIVGAATA